MEKQPVIIDNQEQKPMEEPIFEDEVEEPILRPKKLLTKKQDLRIKPKKEFKEPLLLLMTIKGEIRLLQNMKEGPFIISPKDDPTRKKAIMLTKNKQFQWVYGKHSYKTWVAYEENMAAYPENPVHNSEMFYTLLTKVVTEQKSLAEAKAFKIKGQAIGYIILAVMILAAVVGPMIIQAIEASGKSAAAVEAAKAAATPPPAPVPTT